MATRAIQGTVAPETSDSGLFGNLGHRIWAMSFQLGLAGPSEPAYNDSQALSFKDKAFLHALTMGYIQ